MRLRTKSPGSFELPKSALQGDLGHLRDQLLLLWSAESLRAEVGRQSSHSAVLPVVRDQHHEVSSRATVPWGPLHSHREAGAGSGRCELQCMGVRCGQVPCKGADCGDTGHIEALRGGKGHLGAREGNRAHFR